MYTHCFQCDGGSLCSEQDAHLVDDPQLVDSPRRIDKLARAGAFEDEDEDEDEVDDMAEDALHRMLFDLQTKLGVEDGDVASHVFSGEVWDSMKDKLIEYINVERGQSERCRHDVSGDHCPTCNPRGEG